jgi:hypothetical protein
LQAFAGFEGTLHDKRRQDVQHCHEENGKCEAQSTPIGRMLACALVQQLLLTSLSPSRSLSRCAKKESNGLPKGN